MQMELLLSQAVSNEERKKISYYNKSITIPHKGDIVYISTMQNFWYMLVTKIKSGPGKTGLQICGISLQQKGHGKGSTSPSSIKERNYFEFSNPIEKIKYIPKDRSFMNSADIIDFKPDGVVFIQIYK